MNICRHCKVREGTFVDCTVKLKSGKVNKYYTCRLCNTKNRRKYYSTQKGKSVIVENIKAYEVRNPERRKAWSAARSIPLKPCEVCLSTLKVHRHHPDPRKKLEIVFLCPKHHTEAHKLLEVVK